MSYAQRLVEELTTTADIHSNNVVTNEKVMDGTDSSVTGRKSTKNSDSHSTCSTQPQRKRSFPRFSLRRLLYSSPLMARRVAHNYSRHKHSGSDRTSRDVEKGEVTSSAPDMRRTGSKTSVGVTAASSKSDSRTLECPLCLTELPREYFPEINTCSHQSCYDCLQQYLRIEISESRVCVNCPVCSEPMHPNDIRMLLNDKAQFEKYEEYMVRRVLAVDPDTRWCPAPDCGFAVIAAECASCPKLKCERPGCDSYFCYHCKAEWHPNQTCNAARAQRSPNAAGLRSSSVSFSQDSQHNDIKPCPRCQVLIGKMDDGSCNHMTCAVCGAEFCWLCMKEVSDLHYLSPSGCTFWGKKPWSRKKKILWQLGTLIGAPVGIGLVAGIAIPAMIIGIPVWVGRKLYSRYEHVNKHRQNLIIAAGVTASVLVSPVLAGLAVGIGVPILLFYVYGVVPVSLCRSGGCGVSTSATGVRFDFDDENEMSVRNTDAVSMDAVSHRGTINNPSIGEASLSLGSGTHLERLGRDTDAEADADHESASNVALVGTSIAGSIASCGQRLLEVHADVAASSSSMQRFSLTSSETASAVTSLSEKSVSASVDDGAASTRALAGSVLNYKADSISVSSSRHNTDSSGSNLRVSSGEGGGSIGSFRLGSAVVADPTPSSSNIRLVDNPLSAVDNFPEKSDDALSCLEELTSGLLRRVTGNRRRLEKQASENSSCEDGSSERVRFDEHVSFIGPDDNQWRRGHRCSEVSDTVLEMNSDPVESGKRSGKLRRQTPPSASSTASLPLSNGHNDVN